MDRLRVGIVGASGYSGAVATRLVVAHPRLALTFATSDRVAGSSLGVELGALLPQDVRFVPNASAIEHAEACDAVILATTAEVSLRLAPAFAEKGKQVIDLSGAFRLDASSYPRWYGFTHDAPGWLDGAHYGLPELFGAPPRTAIVANPGCYPTAALLALAPLLRERLVLPASIVVDAKSGVSGAGRQSGDAYSFMEVDDDVRAYKILEHQHTPEIVRGLSRFADRTATDSVEVTFTAHLLPVKRGLLATCYARPRSGTTSSHVVECLAQAYRGARFVRVVPPAEVMLKRVVGTNLAQVGATANQDVVVAIGAIDNLLKGAAGQALQNLNRMNGWDEDLGLGHLERVAP
jgi:N-acetyl-gamma-glutamyl-phosphate reductase